ncbi:phosphatase PAP2 family protein [Prosthecobacter sp.]|uniref:phosphatase PAP2 family protein n=1 Tax=Prosthecobacter sp. TaxID=1965333 RepID=UPI003784EEA6
MQIHEGLYLGFGVVLCVALACLHGWDVLLLEVAVLTCGYALLVRTSAAGGRMRLAGAYVATWALYAGSSMLVEALAVPLRHHELLAADAALFGVSPVLALRGVTAPWMNDVLSAGYMSYHVYLHWALLQAFIQDGRRLLFSSRLFTAFAVGFAGYLLYPAAPPLTAFPELFSAPLPGGLLTHWNEQINHAMASRYDAFPSLHVLITLTLLAWDWRCFRLRFWLMLLPSLLMLAATLVLRLHYAVDLLAAALLFLILHFAHGRTKLHSR